MRNFMATMRGPLCQFGLLLVLAALCHGSSAPTGSSIASPPIQLPPAPQGRFYQFNLQEANYSVNCQTKSILTVNGQFPGPTIYANEGDRVIVNVTNLSVHNITIHFHGVRQAKSPWMDGVAYITQCPIQSGDYFTHDFIIPNQQGTLLWHAHIGWERATVHGLFITYPTTPYPFPKPYKEFPVILAEWWYGDIDQIEATALAAGSPFPNSDALLINGHPGALYNCSLSEGVSTLNAVPGKTYLLRIINAGLNAYQFFAVANHTVTVVEADGEYVLPFQTPFVLVAPGQTTNVLLTANQPGGTYYMSAHSSGRDNLPGNGINPTAIFKYKKPSSKSDFPFSPILPAYNDTGLVESFTTSLKGLFPGRVPLTVNRNLEFVVGLSDRTCLPPPAGNCTGYRIQGAINNVTFELPTTAILQASYYNISGVFTEDFPDFPEHPYDYTGTPSPPPALRVSQGATRIVPINFNDTVQIVFQDTGILGFENHPFHLHGHNFYVLGQGFGDYNNATDNLDLNLYNPPLRNTVGVTYKGWVVIRIKANNPGVWLLHCHFDKHTSWGMETVFHVHNGIGANNSYNPPPSRLVPC